MAFNSSFSSFRLKSTGAMRKEEIIKKWLKSLKPEDYDLVEIGSPSISCISSDGAESETTSPSPVPSPLLESLSPPSSMDIGTRSSLSTSLSLSPYISPLTSVSRPSSKGISQFRPSCLFENDYRSSDPETDETDDSSRPDSSHSSAKETTDTSFLPIVHTTKKLQSQILYMFETQKLTQSMALYKKWTISNS